MIKTIKKEELIKKSNHPQIKQNDFIPNRDKIEKFIYDYGIIDVEKVLKEIKLKVISKTSNDGNSDIKIVY